MPEALNKKEQGILGQMPRFQVLRFIKAMTKAYNRLCMECKVLVHQDSRRPLSDYCTECQAVLKPIVERFKK